MVGGDVAEGVAGDGTGIRTIDEDGVDVVAIVSCDVHRQVLAILHAARASRAYAAALASRSSDRVAVVAEGDSDGVVAAHIAEGPAVLCGLLLAIHRERCNIPAFLGCDGVALAVAAQHLAFASRCDAAALTRHGGDGIAVACKGG